MKTINKEEIELITHKLKTIDFRKTQDLVQIIQENFTTILGSGNFIICNNGRLQELIKDENKKELGKIIINGYQIISNPFNKFSKNNKYKYLKELPFYLENHFWIIINFDNLCKMYENEEEIVVLSIEELVQFNEADKLSHSLDESNILI